MIQTTLTYTNPHQSVTLSGEVPLCPGNRCGLNGVEGRHRVSSIPLFVSHSSSQLEFLCIEEGETSITVSIFLMGTGDTYNIPVLMQCNKVPKWGETTNDWAHMFESRKSLFSIRLMFYCLQITQKCRLYVACICLVALFTGGFSNYLLTYV